MSAGDTLAAIARGERPEGLLHTCRLVTDAGEAYGIEAVSAHFRAAPLAASQTFADERGVALIAGPALLVGDRYDDKVARLWRVGSAGPVASEPRIHVGFDPDMAQAGGDVFASASDVGAGDWCDRIVAAGRSALATTFGAPGPRRRLFVLRIVAAADRCAALMALAEGSHFRHVGLLLERADARWFGATDDTERSWTPRA